MTVKRGSEVRGISRGTNAPRINSKKGQVTVFIIIGIVVVFAFAAIFYFTQSSVKSSLSDQGEPIIADVPLAFQPLKVYTENCLRQIGERGIKLAGGQGGYIDPTVTGSYIADDPTESSGIDLGSVQIPYWYYNSEPNFADEATFSTHRPELREEGSGYSIETQLSGYLGENLGNCLNNYEVFTEQGFTTNVGAIEDVEIQVRENSVGLFLEMPVEATKGDAQASMDQFYVQLPIKLKRYYEIASLITEAQRNYTFLERQGIDLIQTYSGVDPDKLPPTSGLTFDLVPTATWSLTNVEEKFKSMLSSNVQLLRYATSDNFERYEFPVSDLSGLYQQNYDNMILPLEGGEGLNINFDYFAWEPYFDLNYPDDTIAPQQMNVDLVMFPFAMQKYNTVYDVSYPVLVTISDPAALDGEGFNFVFALEANIRDNRAVKTEGALAPEFVSLAESMVCDTDKRHTDLIKTVVLDTASRDPLEAVQIGFTIPDEDTCIMGLTDGNGELEENYPAVYGGIVSLTKEGYLTNFYPIDTYKYKDQPLVIGYSIADIPGKAFALDPILPINATVKVLRVDKCVDNDCPSFGPFAGGVSVFSHSPALLDEHHKWVVGGGKRAMHDSEDVIMTLKRVSDLNGNAFSDDFTTTLNLNGPEIKEMFLVPGFYEVTAYLSSTDGLFIPGEERCSDGIGEQIGCWDSDGCCFDIPGTEMEKMIIGQIDWTEERYYLKIPTQMLYDSDSVEFYVPGMNVGEGSELVIEDLQMLGKGGEISKKPAVKRYLRPKFR